MAFLRFFRDKRGYEYFSLVQPTNRRGKGGMRLLYWYRTPPNVRVGREPFDELVRRELESKNPDVVFDWQRILATPIPSADAEKWRERRRLERAEKAMRRAAVEDEETSGDEGEPGDGGSVAEAAGIGGDEHAPSEATDEPASSGEEGNSVEDAVPQETATVPPPGQVPLRKRRRRRRRRDGGPGAPPGSGPPPGGSV